MKLNGLEKEISDRLSSKDWSSKICDAVYKKRRWNLIQLGFATFLTAFFSSAFVWMLFFEQEGGGIARNELQSWVQEQISGTTAEAESNAKHAFFTEEQTARNMPASLDVDALIEASLDRR
ncbi:hypothetical protein AB3N59_00890 [Leptospira sp. WS92.C1]